MYDWKDKMSVVYRWVDYWLALSFIVFWNREGDINVPWFTMDSVTFHVTSTPPVSSELNEGVLYVHAIMCTQFILLYIPTLIYCQIYIFFKWTYYAFSTSSMLLGYQLSPPPTCPERWVTFTSMGLMDGILYKNFKIDHYEFIICEKVIISCLQLFTCGSSPCN